MTTGATRGQVTGRITVAQEDRIRVVDDLGRGYLFTVRRWRAAQRDLERWRDAGTAVRVRYSGVPDAGAIADAIRPLDGGQRNGGAEPTS
jgi:hypothetical protein